MAKPSPLHVETQARIERITSQLESEYGLDGWLDIHHIFDTGYDGDTTCDDDGAATIYPTTAITTPSWKYRTAKIRWFLSVAAPQGDDDLILVATHEYLHILISPVVLPHHKSMAADLEEYVVESIARVICRVRGMNVH